MDLRHLQLSGKVTAITAFILLALIGYIDFKTGNELSLSVFYLLPVSLAALNAGKTMGISTAVISAVVETAVQLWGGYRYSTLWILFWNTGILMAMYILLAMLVAFFKDAYEKEMQHVSEMEKINEELQTSYREMESFSYSVSHDLRAPLRIINGLSDAVLKDHCEKLDDEGRKLLKVIQKNTERMDKLISALLDLSKIGRQEMRIDEINMEKTAKLIADELKAGIPERAISVTIKDLPSVHGDAVLIRQVITNLLSNAFKFTRDRDVALVEIGSRRDGGDDVFYVKDNGAGFDMAYGNKLFGVFQRLHSLKEFEGTGVGLSIVERIIKRHGGRVWAEGKRNEGATFYFALPARKD